MAGVEFGDGRKWLIVAMLFCTQIVNVADKLVVGLAGDELMREFRLSPEQYGFIASSFYSLYAVTGVLVGWFIAPRVRPRFILAALLVVWSMAQIPIVFSASFGTLIACRAILGMGEGPGTATTINAVHEWFPGDRRNMPTAFVMLGTGVGSFIAAPVLSIIVNSYGWRTAFLTCGLIGGVMLAAWLLVSADGPYDGTANVLATPSALPRGSAVTKRQLWTDRSVYGSLIVNFSSYWLVGFMVSWLAPFGTVELGFDRVTTGWYLSCIYFLLTVIILGFGALSDLLLRRGYSSRHARATLNGACLLASAICFGAALLARVPPARMLLVGAGAVLANVTFTLNPPLLSDMVPAGKRNGLISVLIPASTLAGLISPAVLGHLISAHPHLGWSWAFALNAAIALIAATACIVLLHPEHSKRRFEILARAAG